MKEQLDYKRMIKEVDLIVNTDFCYDMDLKTMRKSKPYTQEEARKMAQLLARVYLISHCVTCNACNRKYLIKLEGK